MRVRRAARSCNCRAYIVSYKHWYVGGDKNCHNWSIVIDFMVMNQWHRLVTGHQGMGQINKYKSWLWKQKFIFCCRHPSLPTCTACHRTVKCDWNIVWLFQHVWLKLTPTTNQRKPVLHTFLLECWHTSKQLYVNTWHTLIYFHKSIMTFATHQHSRISNLGSCYERWDLMLTHCSLNKHIYTHYTYMVASVARAVAFRVFLVWGTWKTQRVPAISKILTEHAGRKAKRQNNGKCCVTSR